jgi:hypothetical protein
VAEIDEPTFMYWLEVLPPVFMRGKVRENGRVYFFGFAEGYEPVKGFWCERDLEAGTKRYLTENTGVMNPRA